MAEKTAVRRTARRTKRQMAEDQHAYFRLKEILKTERAREDKSEVLIKRFEQIEAELEKQGLQDWKSLKFG